MIEFLYNIDVDLFYFINHTLSNSFFDKVFPYITDINHWYIPYLILIIFLLVRDGSRGRFAVFFIAVLITVADQFSSSFLKHAVKRIRPCNDLPDVNILTGCTSSYSFPSSHAVNNFALAVFLIMLYPKYKWELLVTASLIALSRVYCGVHYPSDILGGAIIGSALGFILGFITIKTNDIFIKKYSRQ